MAEKNDGAPDKTGDRTSIDAYVIKDPETFARNLARMIEEAGHAASAWIAPRETGEHTDTVAEPMADVVKTFSKVSEYWLADPQRAVEAQTRLFSAYMEVWSNSIRRKPSSRSEATAASPIPTGRTIISSPSSSRPISSPRNGPRTSSSTRKTSTTIPVTRRPSM